MTEKKRKERARAKRRRLRQEILKRADIEVLAQDCPWTCVRITLLTGDNLWFEVGFSKVCHPDEWDAKHGIDVAAEKAAGKLAKTLVEFYGVKL